MTEYLLIRHGLPARGVDPGLSEEGYDQARRLGRWLRSHKIDLVVSSPIRRARETAVGMIAAIGDPALEPVILEELREFGEEPEAVKNYVPSEQIPDANPVIKALAEGRYEDIRPRAEWPRYRRRARRCLEALSGLPRSERVAVVGHGGLFNAVVACVLDHPGVFLFYPKYTSVTRIERLASGRMVVRSLNETCHLMTMGPCGGETTSRTAAEAGDHASDGFLWGSENDT